MILCSKNVDVRKPIRTRRQGLDNCYSIVYCAMCRVAETGLFGRTWQSGEDGMGEMGMDCMGTLQRFSPLPIETVGSDLKNEQTSIADFATCYEDA